MTDKYDLLADRLNAFYDFVCDRPADLGRAVYDPAWEVEVLRRGERILRMLLDEFTPSSEVIESRDFKTKVMAAIDMNNRPPDERRYDVRNVDYLRGLGDGVVSVVIARLFLLDRRFRFLSRSPLLLQDFNDTYLRTLL